MVCQAKFIMFFMGSKGSKHQTYHSPKDMHNLKCMSSPVDFGGTTNVFAHLSNSLITTQKAYYISVKRKFEVHFPNAKVHLPRTTFSFSSLCSSGPENFYKGGKSPLNGLFLYQKDESKNSLGKKKVYIYG